MARSGLVALAVLTIGLGAIVGCSSGDDDDDGGNEITPGSGSGGGSAPTGGSAASGGSAATGGGGTGAGGTGASSGASGGGTGGGFGGGSMLECSSSYEGLDECGSSAEMAEVEPVEILLIVDKSGSMQFQPVGYEDYKWPSLRRALEDALPRLAPYTRFGFALFPSRDVSLGCTGDACCQVADTVDVAIGPGEQTVPQILGILAEPTGPGGRTPTAAALRLAYEYFGNLPIGVEGTAPRRFVVLATDGGPNCGEIESCSADQCTVNQDGTLTADPYNCGPTGPNNCCDDASISGSSTLDCLDSAAAIDEVEALYADLGVSTAVIGIPGSEPYEQVLNQLAVAGQVVNEGASTSYFRVEANRPDDLVNVFVNITMDLIKSCNILLSEPPPSPGNVNIAIDCVALPQTDPVSGAANWEMDVSTNPPTLRLVGEACDHAMSAGVRRVDVLYGCPTIG